jgi:hypothetical protein
MDDKSYLNHSVLFIPEIKEHTHTCLCTFVLEFAKKSPQKYPATFGLNEVWQFRTCGKEWFVPLA